MKYLIFKKETLEQISKDNQLKSLVEQLAHQGFSIIVVEPAKSSVQNSASSYGTQDRLYYPINTWDFVRSGNIQQRPNAQLLYHEPKDQSISFGFSPTDKTCYLFQLMGSQTSRSYTIDQKMTLEQALQDTLDAEHLSNELSSYTTWYNKVWAFLKMVCTGGYFDLGWKKQTIAERCKEDLKTSSYSGVVGQLEDDNFNAVQAAYQSSELLKSRYLSQEFQHEDTENLNLGELGKLASAPAMKA